MGKRYNRIKRLVKEERALPSESISFSHGWRKKILREFGEWAPIETSGPANSTSTTFGYFAGGSPVINGETGQQVTFTYSGLDGVENYPTSIMVDQGFGDVMPVDPPPFSQVGVQGYTAKLNPRYAEAQKKYREEMKEWERKEEQQKKNIEATLKNLGTSLRDVQQKGGGITKVGNSYVAIIPQDTSDLFNLMNNVRIVKLVPCDPSKPMELNRNVVDISGVKRWEVTNAQYADDIYLGIGQQPDPPMESEYLMPRRNGFNNVNPQLDASQEFAQKVGADEFMNARVDAPDPSVPLDYNPELEPKVDPYADRILQLNMALDKMKKEGTLISRYKLVGPGEDGYVDTTNMANAIGYNRKPIYTAPAQEMFAELERLYDLQLAWLEKQNPGGEVQGADDALDDYNRSMGPNSEPPEDPYAMKDPGINPKDEEDLQDILDDLMNKAPGTLTPEEEKLLSGAGYDDYVRGGRTQASGVDAAGLGLSALGGLALGFSGAATGALASLSRAIKGKPPGPYAGQAPRPPRMSNTSKEIWNTHTGKFDTIKNTDKGWDWAQRALRDTGPNSFQNYARTGEMPSGLKGWRPLQGFQPGRSAARGGFGSKPTPQVTSPGGIAATAGAGAGAYALGKAVANAVGLNPQQRRKRGMGESTWDRINKYR